MKPYRSKLGLIFSLLYGMAAWIISVSPTEGSWNGFLLFVLALPFSIISLAITHFANRWLDNTLPLFILLNMAGWYAMGCLFSYFGRRKIK